MLPFDESDTIAWTEEMAGAWGVALPLIEDGDRIAARMAFLETYRSRVQKARDSGETVKWNLSLGWDAGKRDAAIATALHQGRISQDRALTLGYRPSGGMVPTNVERMADEVVKRLSMRSEE